MAAAETDGPAEALSQEGSAPSFSNVSKGAEPSSSQSGATNSLPGQGGGDGNLDENDGAAGKRPIDAVGMDNSGGAPKRRRADDTTGLRKVGMSGLQGLNTDVLKGCLERLGIPIMKTWKQTNNDNAEIWLPEEWAVVAGCCRVLDAQSVKGKVLRIDWSSLTAQEGCENMAPEGAGDGSERTLTRQVAALFDMPYEQQLVLKEALLKNSLRRTTLALTSQEPIRDKQGKANPIPEWIRAAKRGPIVPVSSMHRSPTQAGYRNKNEFTIGFDMDGGPQVGFRYGKFIDGKSGVGSAESCPNIPEEALAVARCMKDFIANHCNDKFACWGPEKHTGVWRQLTVRHSTTGDVLAVVQYSSSNVSREELDATLERCKEFLVQQAKDGKMKLSSLYGQEHNTVSNKAADNCPLIHLYGEECFYEHLLSLKFRISPTAFFQVNTRAAEVLNKLIRDWACASDDQVVLDVCCGTGTIGLCIASHTKQVVGIEICEAAVRDAEANAKLNGISNCVFLAGRAENKIKEAIDTYVPKGSSCVAVVDPPREGLHPRVISLLRTTKAIERVVYVSCNHVNFIEQAVKLCSPNSHKFPGEPFEIVCANGVDLFPHTHHVELVVLLERGETLAKRRQADGSAEASLARTDADAQT